MDALTARTLLFQRKLAIKNVDWTIPQIPELDGQLACLELGADQLGLSGKLAELPDGTTDGILAMAASICLSLVLRETRERIFTDADVEAVALFGSSVLNPLQELITDVSALSKNSIETAKKNSPTIPVEGSSTSSQGS